jgi:tRNA A-37 threonylcarbamoyl transferase component Bud32
MPTGVMVIIDSALIKRARMQMLLSEKGMAEHLGVDFRTYIKVRDESPVQMGKARTVMESLGFRHIEDVLTPKSLGDYWKISGTRPTITQGELPSEWMTLRPLGGTVEVANGLRIQAWQLCQRHMSKRLARGKRYDLSKMAQADRYRSDEFLQRHTRICDKLKKCPFVADNLLNMSDDDKDGWWVVDQWYQGPTLAELLDKEALAPEYTPTIMRQIAQGIEAIHKEGVICRELSPEKVIYDYSDNSIVLTDFEMGKLFDGSPTVRGAKWPKNAYRAPEAEGVDLRKDDSHIDLYSWGRILVHAVTGNGKCEPGTEAEALDEVDLSKKVRDITLQCVDLDRRNRPKSANAVVRAISKWKGA